MWRTLSREQEKKRVRVCDIVNSIYWVRVIHFKIYVLSYYMHNKRKYGLSFSQKHSHTHKFTYLLWQMIWYQTLRLFFLSTSVSAIVLIGVNLLSTFIIRVRQSSFKILLRILNRNEKNFIWLNNDYLWMYRSQGQHDFPFSMLALNINRKSFSLLTNFPQNKH